jgi:tripartite-type tricarboxylate transporter receptor subunit TctC
MAAFISRRSLIAGGTAAVASSGLPARAQSALPDKTIRLAVGFRSNSGPTLIAQSLAPVIEQRIGRHVSIETRASPAGTGAAELLMRGTPDGSTIAVMPSFSLSAKLLVPSYTVNTANDLACVSVIGAYQAVVAVSSSIGVSTLQEYAGWVKANPDKRSVTGITGYETFLRVYGKFVGRELGFKPDVVTPESMTSLIATMDEGRMPACIGVVSALLEHHRSGKLKILMTSGDRRVQMLPKVPTARESGLGTLTLKEWHGVYLPSATPAPVIAEWTRQLAGALADPKVVADIRQLGIDPTDFGPDDVPAQAAAHLLGWKDRMTAVGM